MRLIVTSLNFILSILKTQSEKNRGISFTYEGKKNPVMYIDNSLPMKFL